jgi:DNA polymerase-3 subunit epsilon
VRLSIAALDRLVGLLEERGGRLSATEAARYLLAVSDVSDRVARSLLGPLVAEDARLVWQGSCVALLERASPTLEEASFVVFDLETTGLAAASARIWEIGAVRLERLEPAATFETLIRAEASPRLPAGARAGSAEAFARAPLIAAAMARFGTFARESVLVAHNARFDVAFVDRELERLSGNRLSMPVLDTLPLARNLLRGRGARANLASLAFFFGVSVEPCHRALPDARATAEVFIRLVELAREEGATTVAELQALAAAKPRPLPAQPRAAH